MDWLEEKEEQWRAFTHEIARWQAEYFPAVCLSQCRHHCCNLKDTKLVAPKEEIAFLLGFEPKDWTPYQSEEPGLYRYSAGDCPHYDRASRQCGVWNDPRRPPICREFPFGLYHDRLFGDRKVYVSPACAFDSGFDAWDGLRDLCARHQVRLVRLKASL